jgi:wobble nucleotide-excising tRNase
MLTFPLPLWERVARAEGRDHARLTSYAESGGQDRIAIVRCIRPVLEGYLRYRFPGQFADKDWLGDMIQHIRESGSLHPLWNALAEIEAINEYSKQFHHETNPGHADTVVVNDEELHVFIQRTLAIAGGY